MHHRAVTTFYFLSGFLLMAGLFVLQPSRATEVSSLQTQIKQQFVIGWKQTLGDQPYFTEVYEVVDGVSSFYQNSATQVLVTLSKPEIEQGLSSITDHASGLFAQYFHLKENKTLAASEPALPDYQFVMPANFMSKPPIYNIIPEHRAFPVVSGATVDQKPVNNVNSWVTIQDNFTGQPYCLAIYNATVNKYLGPCRDPGYQ